MDNEQQKPGEIPNPERKPEIPPVTEPERPVRPGESPEIEPQKEPYVPEPTPPDPKPPSPDEV